MASTSTFELHPVYELRIDLSLEETPGSGTSEVRAVESSLLRQSTNQDMYTSGFVVQKSSRMPPKSS
jgi:hypothetical protein